MKQNMRPMLDKGAACFKSVRNQPKFNPLNDVYVANNPTLVQLANPDFASDEQIYLLIMLHNELAICREEGIKAHMDINPGGIPVLVQSWQDEAFILSDAISRKITIGETNKRMTANRNERIQKYTEQLKQLDRELTSAHYAEAQQRQAAFFALAQWSQQQQMLMQNQQMINAINRPVTTNCYRIGNSVQCTSY